MEFYKLVLIISKLNEFKQMLSLPHYNFMTFILYLINFINCVSHFFLKKTYLSYWNKFTLALQIKLSKTSEGS